MRRAQRQREKLPSPTEVAFSRAREFLRQRQEEEIARENEEYQSPLSAGKTVASNSPLSGHPRQDSAPPSRSATAAASQEQPHATVARSIDLSGIQVSPLHAVRRPSGASVLSTPTLTVDASQQVRAAAHRAEESSTGTDPTVNCAKWEQQPRRNQSIQVVTSTPAHPAAAGGAEPQSAAAAAPRVEPPNSPNRQSSSPLYSSARTRSPPAQQHKPVYASRPEGVGPSPPPAKGATVRLHGFQANVRQVQPQALRQPLSGRETAVGHVVGHQAAAVFQQQPPVPAVARPLPSAPLAAGGVSPAANHWSREDDANAPYPGSADEVTARVDSLLHRMQSPLGVSAPVQGLGRQLARSTEAARPHNEQRDAATAQSIPRPELYTSTPEHAGGPRTPQPPPPREHSPASLSATSEGEASSDGGSPPLVLSMQRLEESLAAHRPAHAGAALGGQGQKHRSDKLPNGDEQVAQVQGAGRLEEEAFLAASSAGDSPSQIEDGPGAVDDDAASIELELSRDGFVHVMSPAGGGGDSPHARLAAQVQAQVTRLTSPAWRAGDPEELRGAGAVSSAAAPAADDATSVASRESSRSFLADETATEVDELALLAQSSGGNVFLASEHPFGDTAGGAARTAKRSPRGKPGDITLPLHRREEQAMQRHAQRLASHRAAPPQRLHLLDFRRQGQRPDSPSRTPEEAARKTSRRHSRASTATAGTAERPLGDELAPRAASPSPTPSPQRVLRSMVTYVARKHDVSEERAAVAGSSPLRSSTGASHHSAARGVAGGPLASAGVFSSPGALREAAAAHAVQPPAAARSRAKKDEAAPVFTALPPPGSSFSPAAPPRVGAHLHPSQVSDATWAKASSLRAQVQDFDKHTAELSQTKMHPQSEAASSSGDVNAWGEVLQAGGGAALTAADRRGIAMGLLDIPAPGGASAAGDLGGGTNVYKRSYFSTYARRRVMVAAASHMQAPRVPESQGMQQVDSPLQRGLAMLHAQQVALNPSAAESLKATQPDRDELALRAPTGQQLATEGGAEGRTPIKDAFIDTVETVLQDEESSIQQTQA